MGRWFLERLEQRIERMGREHVYFIDQVDLEAAGRRRVLHIVEQLARIIDLGARGGIDLDQIDAAPGIDAGAAGALTARFGTDTAFAVQALGQDARHGRLAHAAGAGKQVSMMQTAARQRVAQRPQHVLLAGHFAEAARTPFTCECGVGHRCLWRHDQRSREAVRTSRTSAHDRTAAAAPFRA